VSSTRLCQLLSCLWSAALAVLRLHFLLPLALSGGVVASPILGPWVWLRALDAIASGELKKATDIIQELVTQTQERCADQGVNPLTGKPWCSVNCRRTTVCVSVVYSAVLHSLAHGTATNSTCHSTA